MTAVLVLALTFGNAGSVSGDARYYAYHPGHTIRVRLTDSMASTLPGRLIDLDPSDFRQLGPLSAGVLAVRVTWGQPTITPPPTDTAPERSLWDWLAVCR